MMKMPRVSVEDRNFVIKAIIVFGYHHSNPPPLLSISNGCFVFYHTSYLVFLDNIKLAFNNLVTKKILC